MSSTITALYRNRADAESAAGQLRTIGVADVDIVDQTAAGYSDAGATRESRGFWGSLKDVFLPDDDRSTYEEGVRRGNVLLTAHVESGHEDRAHDVLESSDAIDVDAEGETWRASGWAGGQPLDTTDTSRTLRASDRDEEVVPIVEEQLSVGKRDVARGGARVRTYTRETPVHEQVRLREEHVSVERRAVDQPVDLTDDMLRDRTIEMTETSEEAVVGKRARVVEELVVRKDVGERIEEIDDSVRRTEVDVERLGDARVASGRVDSDRLRTDRFADDGLRTTRTDDRDTMGDDGVTVTRTDARLP